MIELLTIIFLIVGIGWFLYDIVNKLIMYKKYKKLCKYYADMTIDIVNVIDDAVYFMDDKTKNELYSDINKFIIDFKKLFNE